MDIVSKNYECQEMHRPSKLTESIYIYIISLSLNIFEDRVVMMSFERFGIGLILVLLCAPAISAQSCDWTGVWNTTYGRLELRQAGQDVIGSYDFDEGRFIGTITEAGLVGTWSEAPTYLPPDDAGDAVLNFTDDCNGFEGRWRYGSSGPWWSDWNGSRGSAPIASVPVAGGSGTAGSEPAGTEAVADVCDLGRFIGVVETGEFLIFDPPNVAGKTARLTRIPIQASWPPESDEIDLAGYEGRAIMVCGREDSGWIYSAKIVDQAGPIITAIVRKVFGLE
jgi:hypothetical protein